MTSEPVRVRVAGFWRRLGAFLVDGLVIAVCMQAVVLLMALLWGSRVPGLRELGFDYLVEAAFRGGPEIAAALGCGLLVALLYYLWFHAMSGQTLGKRLFSICVIDVYGRPLGFPRAAIRILGYLLSGVMLSLGFLWIAFDREKRGLHDWLAGTYVVRH